MNKYSTHTNTRTDVRHTETMGSDIGTQVQVHTDTGIYRQRDTHTTRAQRNWGIETEAQRHRNVLTLGHIDTEAHRRKDIFKNTETYRH